MKTPDPQGRYDGTKGLLTAAHGGRRPAGDRLKVIPMTNLSSPRRAYRSTRFPLHLGHLATPPAHRRTILRMGHLVQPITRAGTVNRPTSTRPTGSRGIPPCSTSNETSGPTAATTYASRTRTLSDSAVNPPPSPASPTCWCSTTTASSSLTSRAAKNNPGTITRS